MLTPSLDLLVGSLIAALLAGALTSALVPPICRLAVALRAIDRPGGRKDHAEPVPRLGGVALAAGIAISSAFVTVYLRADGLLLLPRKELAAFGLGAFLVFLVGLIDDVWNVSWLQKLAVEVAAAVLLVRVGWTFDVLGLPGGGEIALGWFSQVVAVLWIVGVTNAINLIDGLDGLAGGVVAIIAASFFAYALLQGNELAALAMAAILGGSIGFLRHNWAPARIYLGDSGSLLLGFMLAATSVRSTLKAPMAVAILVPVLALGVPIMDTLLVMAARFVRGPRGALGQRVLGMFHADRLHLHHLLLHLGYRRQTVVVAIYGAVTAFCVFAAATVLTKSWILAVALVVVEFVAVLVLRWLGLRAEPTGPVRPGHLPDNVTPLRRAV